MTRHVGTQKRRKALFYCAALLATAVWSDAVKADCATAIAEYNVYVTKQHALADQVDSLNCRDPAVALARDQLVPLMEQGTRLLQAANRCPGQGGSNLNQHLLGIQNYKNLYQFCHPAGITLVPAAPAPSASGDAALNPSRQSSGASQPSISTQTSALPRHWQGTADPADCAAANSLERGTAAWYDTCVPVGPSKSATGYAPRISPQTLLARAKQTCGSPSRETYQCFVNAKVKILLTDDADVQTLCQSTSERRPSGLRERLLAVFGMSAPSEADNKNLNECVDDAYVYGPKGPPSLREKLWSAIHNQGDLTALDIDGDGTARLGRSDNPFSRSACPFGQGLKPNPDAFGAWSCQPLILNDTLNAADAIQAFEARAKEVAAAAVAGVANFGSLSLSVTDRIECIKASYAATLSVLKGGIVQVPDKCRPMADAARAELAYYANAHVSAGNSGVEELLSYLNTSDRSYGGFQSGHLGPPLPGLQGLEPEGKDRRAADCVMRGGSVESCAAAGAIQTQNANCAEAETHWKSIESLDMIEAYQDHLARFPNCEFATVAHLKIEQLKKHSLKINNK